MVVSTQATATLEEIAVVAPQAPRWFQLYVYRDRRIATELVRRAAACGYHAVVLTADVQVHPGKGAAAGHVFLPNPNEFGLVLLLGGDPKHTCVTYPLRPEPFEERIRAISGSHDFSALQGNPLPLKAAK